MGTPFQSRILKNDCLTLLVGMSVKNRRVLTMHFSLNEKQAPHLNTLSLVSSLLIVLVSVFSVEAAHAANWSPVTGDEKLTKLVSGATAQIEINPDVTVTGKYFADGTAKIEAWGETYDRTWQVKGDDQVCYTSFTETECFTFEQDLEKPESYRVRNVDRFLHLFLRGAG